jgi:hypothetical protein
MRYFVEAYSADHRQILGNLDGQGSHECKQFRRTSWFKALPTFPTLNHRVAYYKIVRPPYVGGPAYVEVERVPHVQGPSGLL